MASGTEVMPSTSWCDALILLSDVCVASSFAVLGYRVDQSKSIDGISLQTLFALIVVRVLHAGSHFFGMHHEAEAFGGIYMLLDLVCGVAAAGVGWLCFVKYKATYDVQGDDFGQAALDFFCRRFQINRQFPLGILARCWGVLYAGSAVIAFWLWVARRSQAGFLMSFGICFYEVIAALALAPQLFMFQKSKRVPQALGHFVVLAGLSRLLLLLFWLYYPRGHNWQYPDNRGVQMFAEVLNIAILLDFFYYYVQAIRQGGLANAQGEISLCDV